MATVERFDFFGNLLWVCSNCVCELPDDIPEQCPQCGHVFEDKEWLIDPNPRGFSLPTEALRERLGGHVMKIDQLNSSQMDPEDKDYVRHIFVTNNSCVFPDRIQNRLIDIIERMADKLKGRIPNGNQGTSAM
jgi:uncharacterized C2H2 Zn-finger protein